MEALDVHLVVAWITSLVAFLLFIASRTNKSLSESVILYLVGLVFLTATSIEIIIYELHVLEWL